MVSLAAKSLWARKRRGATTILAVLIGVSLVSGTYVLTDTINKAFDEIFHDSLKGTSVVVSAEAAGAPGKRRGQCLLGPDAAEVRKVPGVRLAAGTIFSPGGLFKENGDTIGAQFSPKFISSHLPDGLESLTYVDGKPPVNGREVSLDKAAADDSGLSIGDKIRVAGQTRAKSYRLVGLTELGNASFGGASIAQLTLPQAQFVTDKVGKFDQISVAAAKASPQPSCGRGSRRWRLPMSAWRPLSRTPTARRARFTTTSASFPSPCSCSPAWPWWSAPS